MSARFPRTSDEMVVIAGDVWNELAEEVERHGKWTVAGADFSDGPGGFGLAVKPGAPPITRMRVTTPDVAPNVVLAKSYDGTAETGEAVPVRVHWQREVGDEIHTYLPVGGTDAVYDGRPVTRHELYRLGSPQYQHMHVAAVTQSQVAWDFHRAHAIPEEV